MDKDRQLRVLEERVAHMEEAMVETDEEESTNESDEQDEDENNG